MVRAHCPVTALYWRAFLSLLVSDLVWLGVRARPKGGVLLPASEAHT